MKLWTGFMIYYVLLLFYNLKIIQNLIKLSDILIDNIEIYFKIWRPDKRMYDMDWCHNVQIKFICFSLTFINVCKMIKNLVQVSGIWIDNFEKYFTI